MRDIIAELKILRLYGMAGAWTDLAATGNDGLLAGSQGLIEHLLDAETEKRKSVADPKARERKRLKTVEGRALRAVPCAHAPRHCECQRQGKEKTRQLR